VSVLQRSRSPRAAVVPALFALVLLAACASGSDDPAAANPADAAPGGMPAAPGASGLLAALDGSTLQVQGEGTQTTVTYGTTTTFTQTVAGTAADVKVGLCVTARPAMSSAQPSPAAADAVTAGSVLLSTPVNGACAGPGGAGPDGARPSGTPRPDRARPSGSARPGGGRAFGANGKILSASGSSFVVERSAPPAGAPTGATDGAPSRTTVTTTASTTYASTVPATAAALATGTCVTALGKADDTGAIAATAISISPAENGACQSGFGRRPGGNGTGTGGSDD